MVFIEQPIKMDLLKIATGKLTGKSISDGVSWEPKSNTVFHLIHKDTGKVTLSLSFSKIKIRERSLAPTRLLWISLPEDLRI